MPVTVAWTAPRRTVRCATARHGGGCMPPHTPGCAVPRHVPLGEPRSDAWAGELERSPEVAICRGKWLAAGVVFLCLIACRLSGLAGAHGAPRRASLVVPGFGLPDKLLLSGSRSSVSYTLFLDGIAWAQLSRQAPLAGALSSWPGKLLLPGALS